MDNVQTQTVEPVAAEQVALPFPVQQQVHRVNLREFLKGLGGKFATVDFVKLDGSHRVLNGRLGVAKHLKGGQNTTESVSNPYLTVFDVQSGGYRTVNLATVSHVRAQKADYVVVG